MTKGEIRLLAKYLADELTNREVLDIDEASKLTGVKASVIYKKLDEIPHTNIGRQPRFFKGDLIEAMKRNQF